VQFDDEKHRIGEVVSVKIIRAGSNSLFGELDQAATMVAAA
jgi:tRNA-2-methylthio-N6-dimethylallyladenosine synthase